MLLYHCLCLMCLSREPRNPLHSYICMYFTIHTYISTGTCFHAAWENFWKVECQYCCWYHDKPNDNKGNNSKVCARWAPGQHITQYNCGIRGQSCKFHQLDWELNWHGSTISLKVLVVQLSVFPEDIQQALVSILSTNSSLVSGTRVLVQGLYSVSLPGTTSSEIHPILLLPLRPILLPPSLILLLPLRPILLLSGLILLPLRSFLQ